MSDRGFATGPQAALHCFAFVLASSGISRKADNCGTYRSLLRKKKAAKPLRVRSLAATQGP